MTWYQSDTQVHQQQQEWKKLIQKQKPTIQQLMDSDQFCTQLTKNGNIEIMEWVQKNCGYFFGELLTRCLVLPAEGDSEGRKYKQPTKAISFVCNFLESISVPSSGLPTSSISGSMSCSMMGNGCKVGSPEIVAFIIEKMFALYLQNNPQTLYNTLIPGHFFRIFECLNRLHCPILIQSLKTTQHGKLQKLLQGHGKFQQIIDCIKKILIVQIIQNGISNNLQMSVNFTGPSPTVLPHPTAISSGQLNYPYETKHRLIMNILQKIRNYQKIDVFLLENLINILLEILRNPANIFQGSTLSDYICQSENVNVYFDLALGTLREDGTECQAKCLELLKFCMSVLGIVDRQKIYPKIKLTLQKIMGYSKPTIVMTLMLDVINQWFLAETNQIIVNTSLSRSMNSSLSNSMRGSGISSGALPSQAEELLIGQNFFKFLLKMCVSNSSCNIFQYKVTHFIVSVLKSQNVPIINSMFKDDEIIKETITQMKDYKQDGHFGYFMVIIHNYTIRRVNTPIVNEVLQQSDQSWLKFCNQIFQPHLKNKIDNLLGEMQNVEEVPPLQFTVTKMDQNRGDKQKNQDSNKKLNTIDKKDQKDAQIISIQLDLEKKDSDQSKIQNQKQSDTIQPISLPCPKKQQAKQQKIQTQSFQSFLKKKMGENNKLVDERRKSRTPTKMISGESKRKKWGMQNDESPSPIAKKSVSADQKITKPSKIEQEIPKITFIRLSKTGRPKYPSHKGERNLKPETDFSLLKFLEKANSQAKRVR